VLHVACLFLRSNSFLDIQPFSYSSTTLVPGSNVQLTMQRAICVSLLFAHIAMSLYSHPHSPPLPRIYQVIFKPTQNLARFYALSHRHSDLSTIRCVIESASPLVSLIRFRSRLCSYEMHWANCALLKLRMPRQEPPLSVLSEVCQLLMLRMKAAICGGCISIEG